MSLIKINRLPEMLGEKVWETFARPCQLIYEAFAELINDKVYSSCKEQSLNSLTTQIG